MTLRDNCPVGMNCSCDWCPYGHSNGVRGVHCCYPFINDVKIPMLPEEEAPETER